MFLTEEARRALLGHALPRWSVRRGDYAGWAVWYGSAKIAVFDAWADAVWFAYGKAAS